MAQSNKSSGKILPTQAAAVVGPPVENQLLVRWTILNKDLGKHHNVFIEEFPNCLFVRVISCGPECSLKEVGEGGLALIREEVMLAKAERKVDAIGIRRIDREAPFLISEDNIIAFGKFDDLPL